MGLNSVINTSAMTNSMISASISFKNTNHKIDVQNAFRYANCILPETITTKTLKGKTLEDFKNNIFTILDWSSIIGFGFTKKKPKKLLNLLNKYSKKKYQDLEIFIYENYSEYCEMTKDVLDAFCAEMLDCLKSYYEISLKVWSQGKEKILTQLDEEYFKYAEEELDNFIDEIE